MLCEKCKQRPATFHYTEIVNNNKKEMHLCEVCAQEEQVGHIHFHFNPSLNLSSFLAGMIGPGPQSGNKVMPHEARCPRCGLTAGELGQTGLFGCSGCYREFEPQLGTLLRRVHGALRHTGKVPGRGQKKSRVLRDIEQLKAELQDAIAREEYEKAAVFRDRIRELEAGLDRGGGDGGA
ncbi:MAG: UvrB/UvrC motif-containing protein [Bacillota bacterium]|uniref:UvrB/UvrC motif-containing protein n=1 Tax=Desulforudis sp. DRI-14 TaxID=3459793 RepID=UPI00348A94E2